ncbi:MAG: hypothetical protein IT371_04185 [Deltaproteobacteria bacterium]|nr:hypothetical protein [Deltaproteobacteria bacterium]
MALVAAVSAAALGAARPGAAQVAPREAAPREAAPRERVYRLRRESRGIVLVAPAGERLVELLPELWLASSASRGRLERVRLALDPVARDASVRGALAARGAAPGVRFLFRVEPVAGEARLALRFEAHFEREVPLRSLVLRLRTAGLGRATVLDRAYRFAPVRGPTFLDGLTPGWVRFVDHRHRPSFELEEGIEGAWVRPLGGDATELELELLHVDNRPLAFYDRCVDRPRLGVRRRAQAFQLQPAQSVLSARASLWLGLARPALVARFPRGFRAAVALTDHADQASAAKLEAFALGETGALARRAVGAGRPGFVNRGLSYTKSIFLARQPGYAAQFDDPAFLRLLDHLQARGVELGVHSPTGKRDAPEAVDRLVARFAARYRGRTWIDHQPDTNCEAISNRGWDARGPWYVLDVLARERFRYLWGVLDRPLPRGVPNLLDPAARGARRPVLFQHRALGAGEVRFWLFATSFLFVDRPRLFSLLGEGPLARLMDEHGLLLGHVYLDTQQERGRYASRSLLERVGPERYRLRRDADALFARLARHQEAGELWVAGLEAVADHLLAARAVRLRYRDASPPELWVEGPKDRAVRGLTLRVPGPAANVTVDGREPDGARRDGAGVEVWLDLPPGARRRVAVRDPSGAPRRWGERVRIVLDALAAGDRRAR